MQNLEQREFKTELSGIAKFETTAFETQNLNLKYGNAKLGAAKY